MLIWLWAVIKYCVPLFLVGSAFVISASIIYVYADPTTTSMLGNAPFLTWMLGGVGGFVLLFSWPSHRS